MTEVQCDGYISPWTTRPLWWYSDDISFRFSLLLQGYDRNGPPQQGQEKERETITWIGDWCDGLDISIEQWYMSITRRITH